MSSKFTSTDRKNAARTRRRRKSASIPLLTFSAFFCISSCCAQSSNTTSSSISTVISASTPSTGFPPLNCLANEKISFVILPGAILVGDASARLRQFQTFDIGACIEACRRDERCLSANFETGFCSYSTQSYTTSPQALRTDDFPVFPTYIEKVCLSVPSECKTPWQFERVLNHQLPTSVSGNGEETDRKSVRTANAKDCLNTCITEREFLCRSVQYDSVNGNCVLSRTSRQMEQVRLERITASAARQIDYFDNACTPEPRAYCEFNRIKGRVLKASDVVKSGVKSEDECRQLCIDAPFPCQYYHYAQLSEDECSISHHTSLTLSQITEPYVFSADFTSYEVRGCFDVKLECSAKEMTARITTNRVFDGMVYARSKPKTCYADVTNATDFALSMPLDGARCDTEFDGAGNFSNFIMIQNHKSIVTSRDMGLSVHCQYDLRPKNITSKINTIGQPSITETIMTKVPAPVVEMSIRDFNGNRVQSATVGDKVYLQFDLLTGKKIYGIFVKDVIAIDGIGRNSLKLVDSDGCPGDDVVLGPVESLNGGNTVRIAIEVFKFPFNEDVDYMALIKPCHDVCEAATCKSDKSSGISFLSYGKKRRRRRSVASNSTSTLNDTPRLNYKPLTLSASGGLLIPTETTTPAGELFKTSPSQVADEGVKSSPEKLDALRVLEQQQRDDVLIYHRMHVRDKYQQCVNGTIGCSRNQRQLGNSLPTKDSRLDGDLENGLLPETSIDPNSNFRTSAVASAYVCVHRVGIAVACSGFILLQTLLIAVLVFIYRRYKRKNTIIGVKTVDYDETEAKTLADNNNISYGVRSGYKQTLSLFSTPWTLAKRQHRRNHRRHSSRDAEHYRHERAARRPAHDRHRHRTSSGGERGSKYSAYPNGISTATANTNATTTSTECLSSSSSDFMYGVVNNNPGVEQIPTPPRRLKWFTLRRPPISNT